ncbi:MAG TPA: TerC family protein [Bacillales bacterium]|nr:TerC family protein [Bacillales bacterium]
METIISFFSIIAIDIILGGDNAVVIALASRNLPESKRMKAIFYGTGLAVLLRACLTILVVYLLKIPFLLLTGGILLTFIAYQLLIEKPEKPEVKAGTTLFSAIRTIVFADLVMGLDNMFAVAGAAGGQVHLIIIGFLFSVPIIIWGSKLILILLEHFPTMIYIGGAILAFTAARMITDTPQFQTMFAEKENLTYGIWIALPIAVLIASWMTNRIRCHSH